MPALWHPKLSQELMRQRPMKKIPDIDMDIENDAIREIQKFVKGFVNFVQFVSKSAENIALILV